MKHIVTVRPEKRPRKAQILGIPVPPFGCVEINGQHVWRFEDVNQAEIVKANIERALRTSDAGLTDLIAALEVQLHRLQKDVAAIDALLHGDTPPEGPSTLDILLGDSNAR